MKTRGFRFDGATVVVMLAIAGCPAPDPGTGGNDDSSGGSGSSGDRDTDSMTSAGAMSNSGGDSTTGLPPDLDTTAGSDVGEESAGFITSPTDTGGIDPQPNGAQCTGNAECESGYCYEIPTVGGFCSECINDVDCGMGTCSIDFTLLYAVCTDGELGVMCDSSRGCMEGLVCSELVDTGGFFPLDFCSECGDEQACEGEQICSPVYDQVAFQGYMGCVDPMSVENGGGCPVDEAGQGNGEVCASGNCAIANVFMVVDIGVCGECDADEDCTPPEVCQPPMVDMTGITPSAWMWRARASELVTHAAVPAPAPAPVPE